MPRKPVSSMTDVIDTVNEFGKSALVADDTLKSTSQALNNANKSFKDTQEAITKIANIDMTSKNSIPPHNWFRNKFGLLSHIPYTFNEDGSINWRALIKKEYLVPNRSNFERLKQPVPTSIDNLQDRDLLILLPAIKEISSTRGYSEVDYEVIVSSPEYVSTKCTITWIPSYESNYQPVKFSALADASLNNTSSFAKYYLSTISENRSFIRAVKSYLKIHILGQDEIGMVPEDGTNEPKSQISTIEPHPLLQKKLEEKNISFEKLKVLCIGKEIPGAESWEKISDIDGAEVYKILGAIAKKEGK